MTSPSNVHENMHILIYLFISSETIVLDSEVIEELISVRNFKGYM